MIELIATAASGEPSFFERLMLFVFAWLTGMGMIVATLVIIAFIVLIIIGSSEQ
jgi:hypothetical protein